MSDKAEKYAVENANDKASVFDLYNAYQAGEQQQSDKPFIWGAIAGFIIGALAAMALVFQIGELFYKK